MKVKLLLLWHFRTKRGTFNFDEATSGLDPIIRDDILDILIDLCSRSKIIRGIGISLISGKRFRKSGRLLLLYS